MENAKISIIVPVYNKEKYLKRCLESILNQTYQNLEIILVDDGSTDASPAIAGAFAEKDSRIVYIRQENSGVSAARNTGINAATGEFIGFIDSDDFIEPEMYEKLMAPFVEQEGIDLTVCGYFNKKAFTASEDTRCSGEEALIQMFDLRKTLHFKPYNWNKLFRASIIKEHNILFDTAVPYNEDAKFNFDYFLHIRDAYIINYCGYHYVVNSGSVSRNFNLLLQCREHDLLHYFLANSPSALVSKYIINWSINYYKYYTMSADRATIRYIGKSVKGLKKQYARNDLLSASEKQYILALSSFNSFYYIFRKTKNKFH